MIAAKGLGHGWTNPLPSVTRGGMHRRCGRDHHVSGDVQGYAHRTAARLTALLCRFARDTLVLEELSKGCKTFADRSVG